MSIGLAVVEALPATAIAGRTFGKHEIEHETICAALVGAWMLGTLSFALSLWAGLLLTAAFLGFALRDGKAAVRTT